MAEMGVVVEKHHHEVASAQHELGIKFGPMVTLADHMQIYKYVIHQVAQAYGKTATLHAQARLRRQRLGHALPPVDLEGLHAGVRRQQVRRPVRYLPQLHRRHPEARQDHQRLHQPDHQLLQASGAGLRGARAARLLGAQPLGVLPHPGGVEPESQAHRDPLPRSGRQPLPGVCRHADGRSRRHPEQDQSGRGDRQEPLRPAAGGALQDPDRVRVACARR